MGQVGKQLVIGTAITVAGMAAWHFLVMPLAQRKGLIK